MLSRVLLVHVVSQMLIIRQDPGLSMFVQVLKVIIVFSIAGPISIECHVFLILIIFIFIILIADVLTCIIHYQYILIIICINFIHWNDGYEPLIILYLHFLF